MTMDDYGRLFRYDIFSKGLLVAVGALAVIIVAWISPIVRSWIQKRKRLIDFGAKLPGPKCLPLIGNALQFACKPEELFDRIVEAIVPYDDVTPMRFWLGPILHVVVTEPRDIGIILNSPKSTVRGLVYRLIQPFIGDGLISGSGPSWRAHRKLFAPLFNGRTLEGFADISQKHIKILVEKLKPLADGVEFDFGPYLNRCTIDATCETVMGCRDMNAQDNPDQDFPHATDRLYEIIHNRMMKVWYHPDWIFRLSPSYREQVKCQRVIHSFTEKLIAAKQEEFSALLKGEKVSCEGDRNSILEQLIEQMEQDKSILNHEELRDEIYTIYLATQDPTALIGNFTLLMLGIHKDVQDNVRSELNRVLQDDAADVSPSLLPQLKYLEMVIKETLRLFPVAPYLVRALRDDLALETCVLPKGCQVLLPFYITHRSPRHWKNPEKFIPERFTTEEIALRHPYIYVPFSSGLMGCIGQKFAMISLKLIIASVVRSYRITSTTKMEDIKLKSDISIRSVNGFNLALEPLLHENSLQYLYPIVS